MARLFDALYRLCVTVWVGGMLVIGYLAAPVLFQTLPDRTLAGNIAGQMFAVMAWLGLACGVYLLAYLLARQGAEAWKLLPWRLAAAMLCLLLLGRLGIQPVLADLKQQALPLAVMASPLSRSFALWHGVSSAVLLLQSLLGVWLVLVQHRGLEAVDESAP